MNRPRIETTEDKEIKRLKDKLRDIRELTLTAPITVLEDIYKITDEVLWPG